SWPAVETELANAFNSLGFPVNPDVSVKWGVVPLQTSLTESEGTSSYSSRDMLYAMWAAVGLVLVIACVNLAGLLIARNRLRAKELATRIALGSGRRAVIRQLLVECLVIAVAGAAL